MAYIGREPQIGNFQVCDAITTSATATYNLLVDSVAVSPETANHCIVSLNGVIQAPTAAFTISGSTIVFASALTSSDVIDFIQILGSVLDLGVPSDDTVSTAKIVDANVTLAKLSATGTKNSTTFLRGDNTFDTPPLGGITMADQWRPNASISGNSIIYTTEWVRISGDSPGYIGSAMTQSSGIFTFPSTGKYWIQFRATQKNSGSSLYIGANIEATQNNSSFSNASISYSSVHASNAYQTSVCSLLFNCSNTSTHKVRFGQAGNQSGTISLIGGSGSNESEVTFIRLGD